jgi:hypothetical protein
MWNLKKASSEEEVAVPSSSSSRPSMFMNPYEVTKQELLKKLKFFAVYLGGIVIVPKLLRSIGLLEPIGIPLTRR